MFYCVCVCVCVWSVHLLWMNDNVRVCVRQKVRNEVCEGVKHAALCKAAVFNVYSAYLHGIAKWKMQITCSMYGKLEKYLSCDMKELEVTCRQLFDAEVVQPTLKSVSTSCQQASDLERRFNWHPRFFNITKKPATNPKSERKIATINVYHHKWLTFQSRALFINWISQKTDIQLHFSILLISVGT